MDQVCHSQGKIKGKQYQTICKTIIFKRQGISLIVSKSVKSHREGILFSLHTNPMKGVKDFNMETEILVVCEEN